MPRPRLDDCVTVDVTHLRPRLLPSLHAILLLLLLSLLFARVFLFSWRRLHRNSVWKASGDFAPGLGALPPGQEMCCDLI